jgi:tRNA(Ile)-lysidine synthase
MDVLWKYFYCADSAQVAEALSSNVCRHRLLESVTRLGLAVSGGADSVALFHLMLPVCRKAGISLTVVHLNHGLRAEADLDARFVCELAESADIPMLYDKVSVSESLRGGVSLEMAAREARLAFFARCCEAAHLDAIATGHQADDVAESLLLRLARGAGATGLSGLRPLSKISVPGAHLTLIRPLLPLSGAALRDWLRQNKHAWREDASNRDCSIPRNRVRHGVLPHLEATWTHDLRARLCQSAEALREDDALLDALASRHLDAMTAGTGDGRAKKNADLPVAELCHQPTALQRRMLRHWLFRQKLPEAAGLESVIALLERCHTPDGWKLQLPGGSLAICARGQLSIARADAPAPPDAEVLGNTCLAWGTVTIRSEPDRGVCSVADGLGICPAVCTLDADRLKGKRLFVRVRQPGDRIAPTGLKGSKKLQDLFVDAKIPEHLRDTIPVFVCGSEVVWVPGYRVSRHFAVPSPDAPSVRITVSERGTGEDACPAHGIFERKRT